MKHMICRREKSSVGNKIANNSKITNKCRTYHESLVPSFDLLFSEVGVINKKSHVLLGQFFARLSAHFPPPLLRRWRERDGRQTARAVQSDGDMLTAASVGKYGGRGGLIPGRSRCRPDHGVPRGSALS